MILTNMNKYTTCCLEQIYLTVLTKYITNLKHSTPPLEQQTFFRLPIHLKITDGFFAKQNNSHKHLHLFQDIIKYPLTTYHFHVKRNVSQVAIHPNKYIYI